VAVSIDEMISTVEPETGSGAAPASGPAETGAVDEERFLFRYGAAIRAVVREELERYLRNLAD
jgi:hypothetical protein